VPTVGTQACGSFVTTHCSATSSGLALLVVQDYPLHNPTNARLWYGASDRDGSNSTLSQEATCVMKTDHTPKQTALCCCFCTVWLWQALHCANAMCCYVLLNNTRRTSLRLSHAATSTCQTGHLAAVLFAAVPLHMPKANATTRDAELNYVQARLTRCAELGNCCTSKDCVLHYCEAPTLAVHCC
jgi:hypothetical protein